ncbi:hypothetical protein HS088_TW03G00474 [Tripterygium wilfordii]|uniref:pectinesterase n=1 Tax=Tripterygium wilfordii TaxID=458696 RepID=A0A7J7DUU2_TRIWF|nr:hypothetical protein HS088_TW03G00474 [Tripterygium wilfordii]
MCFKKAKIDVAGADIQCHREPRVSKATLDPALDAVEAGAKVIKIGKTSGEFETITEASNGIPSQNTKRAIISLGLGEYQEKVKIERTKPFFFRFYDAPSEMSMIVFGDTTDEYGMVDSATLIVESDHFVAANIIVMNSMRRPNGKIKGAQAMAARISRDKLAMRWEGSLLGAWMPNPTVIFAFRDLGSAVAPEGWSENFKPEHAK